MRRLLKPAAAASREPFFGEWQPIVLSILTLGIGLGAIATFYSSVFAAVHVVAADNGAGREQLGVVTLWVCALFLLQGLIPLVRFSISVLPDLVSGRFGGNGRKIVIFALMLMAGAVLIFT